jgi:hypothetical protein
LIDLMKAECEMMAKNWNLTNKANETPVPNPVPACAGLRSDRNTNVARSYGKAVQSH